jgi:hypothetical protein
MLIIIQIRKLIQNLKFQLKNFAYEAWYNISKVILEECWHQVQNLLIFFQDTYHLSLTFAWNYKPELACRNMKTSIVRGEIRGADHQDKRKNIGYFWFKSIKCVMRTDR